MSVDTNGFSTKELMTVADVCCWITKTRGVTEAAMLDHDMAPLTEELLYFFMFPHDTLYVLRKA